MSKNQLIEIILKLDARVRALEGQLREVRSAKAPFGKGKRNIHPKRSGRHAGKGKFSRRPNPVSGPGDVVQALDAPLSDDQRNYRRAGKQIERELDRQLRCRELRAEPGSGNCLTKCPLS